MTTYQEYEQMFATELITPSGASVEDVTFTGASTSDLPALLQTLIDALPYYSDTTWESAHRGALINLVQTNLPNAAVAAQPPDIGFGYSNSYSYNGAYTGYNDAFYNGITQTAAAAAAAVQVQEANASLNASWWGNYGVAILTDAVRQVVGLSLDTGKLAADLGNYNAALLQVLAPTYFGVYTSGYAPTANALAAIVNADQRSTAQAQLNTAILNGQFSANIRQAIATGGPSATAATWFLFNLWITLKALGNPDVDAAITQYTAAGLTVPAEIGPDRWWTGGYTSWWVALSGADVSSAPTISAPMPQQEVSVVTTGFVRPVPVTTDINTPDGYAQSLCYWGSLNAYMNPPDSCFGAGTGVLMADGSIKPISKIARGEMVRTNVGPRAVLLVESPKRAGRTLYQVNGLNVFATAAHPFRATDTAGPARRAIDAWALADAVPTMSVGGVGTLAKGARLQAISGTAVVEVAVASITAHPADVSNESDLVYDLVLGEHDSPTYYVGGPGVFLAVGTETADPEVDLPTTTGIVAALLAAVPAVRHTGGEPRRTVSALVHALPWNDVIASARTAARAPSGSLPLFPSPDFFTVDGMWDPYASTLEAQLVRRFSRLLRRQTAMGMPASDPNGPRLIVTVHDLELVGEVCGAATAALTITIAARGTDRSGELTLPPAPHARGFVPIDDILDLSEVDARALVGTITAGGETIAKFRVPIDDRGSTASVEHFIFDAAGLIAGRIAIGQHRVAAQSSPCTPSLNRRPRREAFAVAMQLGNEIGARLAATRNSAAARAHLEKHPDQDA